MYSSKEATHDLARVFCSPDFDPPKAEIPRGRSTNGDKIIEAQLYVASGLDAGCCINDADSSKAKHTNCRNGVSPNIERHCTGVGGVILDQNLAFDSICCNTFNNGELCETLAPPQLLPKNIQPSVKNQKTPQALHPARCRQLQQAQILVPQQGMGAAVEEYPPIRSPQEVADVAACTRQLASILPPALPVVHTPMQPRSESDSSNTILWIAFYSPLNETHHLVSATTPHRAFPTLPRCTIEFLAPGFVPSNQACPLANTATLQGDGGLLPIAPKPTGFPASHRPVMAPPIAATRRQLIPFELLELREIEKLSRDDAREYATILGLSRPRLREDLIALLVAAWSERTGWPSKTVSV
jgi:hypothetical protein